MLLLSPLRDRSCATRLNSCPFGVWKRHPEAAPFAAEACLAPAGISADPQLGDGAPCSRFVAI